AVGLLAGLFAAIHPTLVAFSVSTYVEPLYTFLILAATLLCLRFVRNRGRVELAAAGACWGLAYLTRPEALAGGAVAAASVALVAYFPRRRLSASVRSGAILSGAMLALVLPNVIWLSSLAGDFRWEGKSGANSQLNERIQAGMSYPEAARGLEGEDGRVGPFLNMRDQREFLSYDGSGGLNFISSLLRAPLSRVQGTVVDLVRARNLGAPWILLLAGIGLVWGMRWRDRPWEGLVFLSFVGVLGLILLLTEWRYPRFFLAMTSALVVWSAAGAMVLARGLSGSLRRTRPSPHPHRWAPALAALLLVAVSLGTLPSTLATPELNQAASTLAREFGAAIRRDYDSESGSASRPSILGFGLAPGFYAGGTMAYLPYSDEVRALAYVHAAAPDYLILTSSEAGQAPYVSTWLEDGIPDPCAIPILDSAPAGGARSRLWRWGCREAPM
ncbi:MAG TPA: hypothetical protein VLA43_11445, partial [Longimicrobiales bacterium]|nr:hypothetical protein [Longimicrobiales bacterium]